MQSIHNMTNIITGDEFTENHTNRKFIFQKIIKRTDKSDLVVLTNVLTGEDTECTVSMFYTSFDITDKILNTAQ